MVKCLFCGFETSEQSFKLLKGSWIFRFYSMEIVIFPRCRGVFNYYRGVSLQMGGVSEFTVRIWPKAR
jgi:hypothetical protein